MSSFYRLVLASFAAALLLVVVPQDELLAQSCTGCSTCAPGKAAPGWGMAYLGFSGCGPGYCSNAAPCPWVPEEPEGDDEDAEELAALIDGADTDALTEFIATRPFIDFVFERDAVAVRGSCDHLVALLALPEHHLTSVRFAAVAGSVTLSDHLALMH